MSPDRRSNDGLAVPPQGFERTYKEASMKRKDDNKIIQDAVKRLCNETDSGERKE